MENIPEAEVRYGFRNRIIVDKCPFCQKTHIHGGPTLGLRESHCFKGQYKLIKDSTNNTLPALGD